MPHDWPVMHGEFVGRKGVSLERLQTFCLIAEAGGIMAAAKGDPNRQSLFSRQVKELESALGLELLDRSEVPYRPTEGGIRLEKLAREFFLGVDGLLAESRGGKPLVTVGAGESILQWLIIPLLGGPLAGAEWRLRFRNVTSREAIESVRSRRIDVAVVPAEDAAGDLEAVKLATYGVVAVGKPEVFGASKPARWSEVRGNRIALLEGSGRLRRVIDDLLETTGEGCEIGLECTSYPQVIEASAFGGFVGLVPELAVGAAKVAGLEVWRIAELSEVRIDLVLVWNGAVSDSRVEVGELVRILSGGSRQPRSIR